MDQRKGGDTRIYTRAGGRHDAPRTGRGHRGRLRPVAADAARLPDGDASHRHLTAGLERADSWATDAHKWLNVPYDNGIAFCAHPNAHRAALGIRSSYLVHAENARDPLDWNPEHSRRARGFTVYAALRALGRSGIEDLVDRLCARAADLAAGLAELPGCEILNEAVLNQVLLRFEEDAETDRVVRAIQAGGEAWMGGTL